MPSARRVLAMARKWPPSSVWRATNRKKCRARFSVPSLKTRHASMIRFFCPTCRAKVQAPDDNAGRSGHCPACKGPFMVPAASAAELAQTFATGLSSEIPAIPAAPSSRPASPIEVYATAETSAAPPPPPVAAQSAPAQTSPRRVVDDREEWEKAEEEAAALPPPPPRPKVSTGWLPLGLAAAGGLLILITIVVGVMGRNTSKSVAVDANGNALPDQSAQKPKPQIQIIPTIPTTLPSTSHPAIAPPTRDPLVI